LSKAHVFIFASGAEDAEVKLSLKTWESTEDWGDAANVLLSIPRGELCTISPAQLEDKALVDIQHICAKMFPMHPEIFTSYSTLFTNHQNLVDKFDPFPEQDELAWIVDILPMPPVLVEVNKSLLMLRQQQNMRHDVQTTTGAPTFFTFAIGITYISSTQILNYVTLL